MSETRLVCLDAEHAAALVAAATRPGDEVHTVLQDGADVVIAYHDKRWPFDVAEFAAREGHATDSHAADVIRRL